MINFVVDRDVPIPMEDGIVLRCDVYRPPNSEQSPAPVIMVMGPYGKGVPYRDGYAPQWKWLTTNFPDMLPGSTREFMTWETVDPEMWVPWGYVCIRVDSRGAGRSPGYLDVFSAQEVQDYHHCIEWAGTRSWSNGKVGLLGISYYAINQWHVASLQPPHLAAMIPWEGAADYYRDIARHGGIVSNNFFNAWYPRQVISLQHGNPKAVFDPWLGETSSGPERLSEDQLRDARSNPVGEILKQPLDNDWYRSRSADWSKVTVPFLSAASWAGFGLHQRGNFEAFTEAASTQKWLECHPGRHEEWFYLEKGMSLQKQFFDYFLRGEDNGWANRPPVRLNLRRAFDDANFVVREEQAWPLPGTKWSHIYLSASNKSLEWAKPGTQEPVSFDASGDPLTLLSPPLQQETEITGPLAAKIFASSSTTDIDLFVTLQAFSPDGREVDFQGTVDPHTPLGQGWLRASHRKLDPERSRPYRPFHSHDEIQLLEPGHVYGLDVEIWPTNISLPAGFQLALQISGKDFERSPSDDANEAWLSRGSGPWLHTHSEDRPASVFEGRTTIWTGAEMASYLLLPIIDGDRSQ